MWGKGHICGVGHTEGRDICQVYQGPACQGPLLYLLSTPGPNASWTHQDLLWHLGAQSQPALPPPPPTEGSVQALAVILSGALSPLFPADIGAARLRFLPDGGELPARPACGMDHLPFKPQVHLTGSALQVSLGVLAASGLALLDRAASGEHKESHGQVRDVPGEASCLRTGTKQTSLLLFLETHFPGPLAAPWSGCSWEESSLIAVGMNSPRRKRGVAWESACLWLQTPSTALSPTWGRHQGKARTILNSVTAH